VLTITKDGSEPLKRSGLAAHICGDCSLMHGAAVNR
jgi:hypothetical protein